MHCNSSQQTVIACSAHRRLGLVVWLLSTAFFLLSAPLGSASEREAEDRTIALMLRRGLTESAIEYAKRQRLLHADDSGLAARWTARLMECYAGKALQTPSESLTLWKRCETLQNEFSTNQNASPRAPWVRWQYGRCLLLKAQSELAKYLAAPANQSPRDASLQTIRVLLDEMKALEAETRRLQPLAPRSTNNPQVTASELEILRADASLLRCEALLIRSKLYPEGSRDRIAAASDAESTAEDLLTLTDSDWAAFEQLQIAQATARLELGKAEIALAMLTEIARRQPANAAARRAAIATIEFLCRAGKPSRARGFLPLVGSVSSDPAAALSELQIRLAEIQQTTSEAAKEARLSEFLAAVRSVGNAHGGYWQNRAEALLASSGAANDSDSTTRDLVIVQVRQLLAANKKTEAIARLVQASENAAANSLAADAILFAQQAAILMKLEGDLSPAADLLIDTTTRFQDQATSAKAHLAAVRYRSDLLLQDPQNADSMSQYEAALRHHALTWPDDETTQQVIQWAERWLVGRGRASEFSTLLWEQLQKTSRSEQAASIADAWFASLLTLSPEARQELIVAARSTPSVDLAARESMEQTSLAALTLYRWPEPEEARKIDAELARLRAATGTPDSRWLQIVQLIRAIQQGQISAARRTPLDWSQQGIPDPLLLPLTSCVLNAIDGAPQGSVPGWFAAVGFDSETAQRLSQTTQGTKKPLESCIVLRVRATLASDANARRAALESIQQLASTNPRNAWLQFQYARTLSTSSLSRKTPAKDDLAKANVIYRRIMAGSRSSEVALSARWHWMLNSIRNGQTQSAEEAAKLFLASQPIESKVWLQRFQAIGGTGS